RLRPRLRLFSLPKGSKTRKGQQHVQIYIHLMAKLFLAVPSLLLATLTLFGQTVRFETNLGNINVQLLPTDAPKTVANFLQYANSGAFNGSFIHRSVANFVIQGGGYTWSDSAGPVPIPT